jgi:hypothetical protein
MEQRQEPLAGHLARFALRRSAPSRLNREKAVIALSPHLDGMFLSLHATLLSGMLGRNTVGVNFFAASDSSASTKVSTTFSIKVKTSTKHMQENMNFANPLYSHGLNRLSVFLGLKEALMDRYCWLIVGAPMGKLSKKAVIKDILLGIYSMIASNYVSLPRTYICRNSQTVPEPIR